jgi:hypothetical protein
MDNHRSSLRFYEISGITLLKKIIMGSIGKFVLLVNRPEEMPSYFIGHPFKVISLKKTIRWSYFNEIVHFVLIFVTAVIGYFIYLKGSIGGLIIISAVILLNIGLVFLQHLNRIRMHQTIHSLEKRKSVQQDHS